MQNTNANSKTHAQKSQHKRQFKNTDANSKTHTQKPQYKRQFKNTNANSKTQTPIQKHKHQFKNTNANSKTQTPIQECTSRDVDIVKLCKKIHNSVIIIAMLKVVPYCFFLLHHDLQKLYDVYSADVGRILYINGYYFIFLAYTNVCSVTELT